MTPSLKRVTLTVPFEAWSTISHLLKQGTIIATTYLDTGVVIEADIYRTLAQELKPYIQ